MRLKQIVVTSKSVFSSMDAMTNRMDIAVIGITSGPLDEVHLDDRYKGMLLQQWDDIMPFSKKDRKDKTLIPFTKDHAEQIYKFVESVKDSVNTLIVFCDAGLSRSVAVGNALAAVYNVDIHKTQTRTSAFQNSHVLHIMDLTIRKLREIK